ncbi:MAG: hypothetical protein EP330_20510 [Deltaproteobacteria bacterium]|nr:MAG: hypothetical protein EP330_20510 [Deltaproteobacteria bacterium]
MHRWASVAGGAALVVGLLATLGNTPPPDEFPREFTFTLQPGETATLFYAYEDDTEYIDASLSVTASYRPRRTELVGELVTPDGSSAFDFRRGEGSASEALYSAFEGDTGMPVSSSASATVRISNEDDEPVDLEVNLTTVVWSGGDPSIDVQLVVR